MRDFGLGTALHNHQFLIRRSAVFFHEPSRDSLDGKIPSPNSSFLPPNVATHFESETRKGGFREQGTCWQHFEIRRFQPPEVYDPVLVILEMLSDGKAARCGSLTATSALGYQSPEEFEQAADSEAMSRGATMSFFRHREIYRSDGKRWNTRKPAGAGSPRPSYR
jgi:hypothetical protein